MGVLPNPVLTLFTNNFDKREACMGIFSKHLHWALAPTYVYHTVILCVWLATLITHLTTLLTLLTTCVVLCWPT